MCGRKGVMSMKIERISDTQIRCTLSNFDLSERNMNIAELAYGNEKARRLFREMVQKASAEFGFEVEDIPLMVEAIPLSNESVMLVITKVDDPEEMDTRFSRFSPAPENDFSEPDPSVSEPGLESAEAFTAVRDQNKEAKPIERIRIFSFPTLDKVIEAARAVSGISGEGEILYRSPANGSYYLLLREDPSEPARFASLCNKLAEYGTRVRQNYSSDSYFREHYELILRTHALTSLAKI